MFVVGELVGDVVDMVRCVNDVFEVEMLFVCYSRERG